MKEKLEELRAVIEAGEMTIPQELKLISECVEMAEQLEAKAQAANESKDYWYNEYNKVKGKFEALRCAVKSVVILVDE